MSKDIQTLISKVAPRITQEPEAFLAALAVSEEASRSGRGRARRLRRLGVTVGAAMLIAAGGTAAAAAVTQSLRWQAPQ
ncbi:hypothetical protein SAMN06295885_3190 [Rathayibacter oskolensis]|uniref:Uncharacterized protein n=1 Tax=Rathayibacter oskolensis TaxID=1891671 RepID=A0A1X7PE07_9MICO|nr:hypothetical protein [Rathayibacter oskolensis]SMH49023.1 hypothetical protein SAMN06295885_3190 [Rathayibacter oskolensis]